MILQEGMCTSIVDALRSELDLDGDGKAAARAERFARDLEDGRGLLALVFCALDERQNAADEIERDGMGVASLLCWNFGGFFFGVKRCA